MRVTTSQLLGRLPVFNGKRDVIASEQTTSDIIKEVLDAHKFFAKDYDDISDAFIENAPRKLWHFCKDNLPYNVETEELQTTRSPSGILSFQRVRCQAPRAINNANTRSNQRIENVATLCGYPFFEASIHFAEVQRHIGCMYADRFRTARIGDSLGNSDKRFTGHDVRQNC